MPFKIGGVYTDTETLFIDNFVSIVSMKLVSKAKKLYKEKGRYYVIRMGIKKIVNPIIFFLEYYYYMMFKASSMFTFRGEVYCYFYHKYNKTWRNERMVEVPIIRKIVRESENDRILEVGNVLSHYFPTNHNIVDKYELSEGVINEDVVDFKPFHKYDLVISISTLEHVGYHEEPREPTKILSAIENLKSLLNTNGRIVVTLPVGYNPHLDKLLKEGKIQFTKCYYLKRILKDKWIETNWENIENARINKPFPHANGLIIGVIEK